VVTILGILAVAAYSNAAQDTRRVIARQQQAEVQNAVNAWVSSYTARSARSLKDARDIYTSAGTDLARFQLVGDYLDKSTRDHFFANSGTTVQSGAMKKIGVKLEFPTWNSSNSPQVNLN
jgi:type II secretory pathway pseudopilin PulG